MTWLDEPISLVPVHFFSLSFDCFYLSSKEIVSKKGALGKKHLLPSSADLTGDKPFADVSMAWNEEGLAFEITINQSYKEPAFPELASGDSLEIFLDTRDVKSSGYNTRFCHHFYFLAEKIGEDMAGEITHFRGDDLHALCNPELLQLQVKHRFGSCKMYIIIPAVCLHGYEPSQFERLGFSYVINRRNGQPQHFSCSSLDYQIAQQPALWASVRLIPKL